jgi:hypothetical protein
MSVCFTYFGSASLAGLRPVREEGSSLSRRCSSRLTPTGRHLPPLAVAIPRSSNSRAMALLETMPALRSSRIVERKASVRTSAACLFAFPLLTIPFPDVTSPKCVSTLTTVVYCHLPPRAVGIPLRFNSPASDRRDTKPAALSSRMVGTKTRARDSAARLLANAPCNPRLRRDVSPCSIGPSWLVLDVRLGGKNVATSDLLGQHQVERSSLEARKQTKARPGSQQARTGL